MPILEGKCADPKCTVESFTNKTDKQSITCASPFCKNTFHIACAGQKGKKLGNIYFLCNCCNEFIKYSNAPVQEKLIKLEQQITDLSLSINARIKQLENDLSETFEILKGRMLVIENKYESKILEINQTFSLLENNVNSKIEEMNKNLTNFQNSLTAKVGEIHYPKEVHETSSENKPNKNPLLKFQLRISGIKENSENTNYIERQKSDLVYINKILKHLNKENCKVTDCFRLGKFDHANTRPRTVLVTFSSVWDRNMILQSAKLLSSFSDKIYISPALCPSDMQIERNILKKRWQLLQNGHERKDIKVNNLKLYMKGKLIELE